MLTADLLEASNLEDLQLLREHILRHISPEDDPEKIMYHPAPNLTKFKDESFIQKSIDSLQIPVTAPSWKRNWIIKDQGKIIANLELKASDLQSALHRANLGIGIEKNYRGIGLGKTMMKTALIWAKEQNLTWIDLNVLTHNMPARKLYLSFGFKDIGTVKDCFRVEGQSIDDTHMVLELKNYSV
ncbi:MAG: GNAT family N-acetyltransferase [Bacteriovoracaceae bacterium]